MTNRLRLIHEIMDMPSGALAVLIGDVDGQREGCRLEMQMCDHCREMYGECPRANEEEPCWSTLEDWLMWEYDPADGDVFAGTLKAGARLY